MKRPFVLLSAALLAAGVTACSSTDTTPPATTSSTTTSESTTETTVEEVAEAAPEPVAAPIEPPPVPAPIEAPPAAHYVVECLDGTPGPALWSNGAIEHSEYCFHALGGPGYLEAENQAGLVPPPEQTPSPWVQGQIDWANCLDAGNTEEYCRTILP